LSLLFQFESRLKASPFNIADGQFPGKNRLFR
jgi:hypothetical protein